MVLWESYAAINYWTSETRQRSGIRIDVPNLKAQEIDQSNERIKWILNGGSDLTADSFPSSKKVSLIEINMNSA